MLERAIVEYVNVALLRDSSLVTSWPEQVEHARLALVGAGDAWEQAAAAAVLIDSSARTEVAVWLERDNPPPSAAVAFVRGYLHLERREIDEARKQFGQAQTLLRPGDDGLAARIALELGSLYLAADRPSTADAVLARAESAVADPSKEPDLVQLRALIADARGDRREARTLLRDAISLSGGLTPQTRLLAMHNLAVALAHSEADESIALTSLALAQLETGALHVALRPALRNVAGYAWICLGDLDQAETLLVAAQDEADAMGNDEISSYARFNRAIVAELRINPGEAARLLGEVLSRQGDEPSALAVWCRLRLAWVALLMNNLDRADELAGSTLTDNYSPSQQQAAEIIRLLATLARGEPAGVAARLAPLARDASQRDDPQTAFVLTLWQAVAEQRTGRTVAATRLVRSALALATAHRLRWSPNWWATDLAELAQPAGGEGGSSFRSSCRFPQAPTPQAVRVGTDGIITVGTSPIDDGLWRSGRSSPHILRRFFRLLLVQHPKPVPRDRLCDALWPDSDGDRANANLYAAANDLRKVLSRAPGLGLTARDKGYALEVGTNVILESRPRA